MKSVIFQLKFVMFIIVKQFDADVQQEMDMHLAKLITMLMNELPLAGWWYGLQNFIRVVAVEPKATFLVARTIVHMYIEAVQWKAKANMRSNQKRNVTKTCDDLSNALTHDNYEDDALVVISTCFFEQVAKKLHVLAYDDDGCKRIIVRFLSCEDPEETLHRLVRLMKKRNNTNIHQICAEAEVINEICEIIQTMSAVKPLKAALELATLLQR